jgi:hypothetical protein
VALVAARRCRLARAVLRGAMLCVCVSMFAEAQGVPVLKISDRRICSDCRVQATKIVSLLGPEGNSIIDSRAVVEKVADGRYVVGPLSNVHSFAVFDSNGTLQKMVGRAGRGPGEYVAISRVLAGSGDSIHVFDMGARRATLLSPELVYVRSRQLIGPAQNVRLLRGDTILTSGILATRDRTVLPLHVIGPDGQVIRSFGDASEMNRPGQPLRHLRRVGAVTREGVWIAFFDRYVLELWRTDGALVRSIERTAAWFPQWPDGRQQNARFERPRPSVLGSWVDEAGVLWVASYVADSAWKPSAQKPANPRVETAGPELDETDALYDTIVEAIDPDRGLLAAVRLPVAALMIGASGILASYRFDADRDVIDIWRIRLVRR